MEKIIFLAIVITIVVLLTIPTVISKRRFFKMYKNYVGKNGFIRVDNRENCFVKGVFVDENKYLVEELANVHFGFFRGEAMPEYIPCTIGNIMDGVPTLKPRKYVTEKFTVKYVSDERVILGVPHYGEIIFKPSELSNHIVGETIELHGSFYQPYSGRSYQFYWYDPEIEDDLN